MSWQPHRLRTSRGGRSRFHACQSARAVPRKPAGCMHRHASSRGRRDLSAWRRAGAPLAGCGGAEERGWYRRAPVDANRVATGQRTLKRAKQVCASTGFTEAKIWHFLGSAARQRLLAIAAGFDLRRAPIGKWSSSTSLVRKRSPVRIRAWAPNSIAPFPCIFSAISLSRDAARKCSSAQVLYPNLGVAGHSDWHHIHRSGGERRRRSVGPQRRPTGCRTGQDREARVQNPKAELAGFDGGLQAFNRVAESQISRTSAGQLLSLATVMTIFPRACPSPKYRRASGTSLNE